MLFPLAALIFPNMCPRALATAHATASTIYAPTPVTTSIITVQTTCTIPEFTHTLTTDTITVYSTSTLDVPTVTVETIAATATVCSETPEYFFLQVYGTNYKDDTIDGTYIYVAGGVDGTANPDYELLCGGTLQNAALFSFANDDASGDVILTASVNVTENGKSDTYKFTADILALQDGFGNALYVNAYTNQTGRGAPSTSTYTTLTCSEPLDNFICHAKVGSITYSSWTYDPSYGRLRIDDVPSTSTTYPPVSLKAVCAEYYLP